jgi:hypothetical protein
MYETKSLLSLFGYPVSDKKLLEFMSANKISINDELSLGDDEYRGYIERPDDGFSLVFTDEAYFLGRGNFPIGKGELFYSGMFFYSEGKDDYKEYKSDLPFSLSFNDTRTDVLNKLGEQSWQRLATDGRRVISDRWDSLPNVPYRLHVTYDNNTGKISIVSASIPDQPLS